MQVAVTFFLRPALLATQEALQELPRLREGVLKPLVVEHNERGDWRSAAGAVLPPYTVTARGGLETLAQWAHSEKPDFTTCVMVCICCNRAYLSNRKHCTAVKIVLNLRCTVGSERATEWWHACRPCVVW